MTEKAGQILRMARPATYWARRAAYHHRRGNRQQAGVLYQHAVTLTPENASLKVEYARVLQEMRRYEASNRQIFAAISLDPSCTVCFRIIGHNLLALGHPEEAADAFAHDLYISPAGVTPAHQDNLDRLEDLLAQATETSSRYRILIRRAAHLLSIGEWDATEILLQQACNMTRKDERCHALLSLYHRALGHPKQAVEQAVMAVRLAPRNVRSYCTLADTYAVAGMHRHAKGALLYASAFVKTAEDERLFCQTALTLGHPSLALHIPDHDNARVQTLFNKGVLLLKTGRIKEALEALHSCRDLDPDDVSTRYLLRSVQQLPDLTAEEVAQKAAAYRLYPELSDEDSQACYRTFMEALSEGTEAFCQRLQADETLYRLLLFHAENPHTDITGILEQIIPLCSEAFSLKMMREILTLPGGGYAEKQLMIQQLIQKSDLPFVLRHGGRLSFIEPKSSGETMESLQLKHHIIRCFDDTGSARLTTYALRLVHALPVRLRTRLTKVQEDTFSAAIQLHYADAYPAELPKPADPSHHTLRIYKLLKRAVPAEAIKITPPQLWLSTDGKETL